MRHGGEIRQHLGFGRAFREAGEQRPHGDARAFDDERPAAQFRAPLEVIRVVELHGWRISGGCAPGNAGFGGGLPRRFLRKNSLSLVLVKPENGEIFCSKPRRAARIGIAAEVLHARIEQRIFLSGEFRDVHAYTLDGVNLTL